MDRRQTAGMASVRGRMIGVALLVAAVTGGAAWSVCASFWPLLAALASALLTALCCSGIVGRALGELRDEQLALLGQLPNVEAAGLLRREGDDLRAAVQAVAVAVGLAETAEAERSRLYDQLCSAREKVRLVMHTCTTGDEKEIAQMRAAVAAMESLNKAFSQVIDEIDELSGRTEERASISAEMSATTDAIADNINQYSGFVIETSSSIEQMARAIRETADNIRALAASTEQTVSSINQISLSQSTVRDTAERGAGASESVRSQAQNGLRSMAATLKAMQEIEKSNGESFEAINRLSRHSARVGDFLNVIQEVVEQTNLLSLNASIIAAQAGTRGRAFAVVAEEVRSLAHRTSASTREIEELVRNIQKETSSVQRSVTQGKDKVKEGVKISTLANDALVTIEKSAEEASRMVARIATETNDQAAAIARITEEAEKNLERVQQITQNTEHQQEGTTLIVKNLEHMRELSHRINCSAQEQAKGNRLYLKSVMEDNDRTHDLKEEAGRHLELAHQAVDAVRRVEALIAANAREGVSVSDALANLAELVDDCPGERVLELEDEAPSND